MNHILVTTDFSEGSHFAFKHAIQDLNSDSAHAIRCTLLHVLEDHSKNSSLQLAAQLIKSHGIDEELVSEAKSKLDSLDSKFFPNHQIGTVVLKAKKKTVAESLLQWAKDNEVTKIITATHGRTGVSQVIVGSVTEKLIKLSTVPVLVVPVPKTE